MIDENKEELTSQEYLLKLKVAVITRAVLDVNIQGHDSRYDSTLAILIPEKTTQGVLFFNAWLPDYVHEEGQDFTENNKREVILKLAAPIDSICRAAVMRANYNYPEHHLMVMSIGVEDDIKKYNLDGKVILAKALSSKVEADMEFNKDTDRDMSADG